MRKASSPAAASRYLRALDAIEDVRKKAKGDERFGVDIVAARPRAPLRQIAENAGHDGDVVVDDIIGTGATKATWGFDARSGEFVDLVKAGIVDPAKVTRLALENAASVAGLMLMTNTTITSIKDNQDSVAGAVS